MLVLAVFGTSTAFGLRINTTGSMPKGIYRIAARPVTRGSIVELCLPSQNVAAKLMRVRGYEHAGYCPSGLAPLIKPVAAVAGDIITLTDAGVSVNGNAIPSTKTYSRDSAGRELPRWPGGTYSVPAGQLWLISNFSPYSFDSRYFGPVPTSSVKHVLVQFLR